MSLYEIIYNFFTETLFGTFSTTDFGAWLIPVLACIACCWLFYRGCKFILGLVFGWWKW